MDDWLSEDVHLKAPGASARPAWKPRPADATPADDSAQKCAEHAAAVDASDEVPLAGAASEVSAAHVVMYKDWSIGQALDISTAPACLSNVGSLGFGKRKDFEHGYARRLAPDAVVALRTGAAPQPLWGATAVAVPGFGSAPAAMVLLGMACSGAGEPAGDVLPTTPIPSTWRHSMHGNWEVIQALVAPTRSAGASSGDTSAAADESSSSCWQQIPRPADPSLLAALQQPWAATAFVPSAGLLLRHGGEPAVGAGAASGDGAKARAAVAGDAGAHGRNGQSRTAASAGGCSLADSTPAHHRAASRAAGRAGFPDVHTAGASSSAPPAAAAATAQSAAVSSSSSLIAAPAAAAHESSITGSSAASVSPLLHAHPPAPVDARADSTDMESRSASKRPRVGTGVDIDVATDSGSSVAVGSARESGACASGDNGSSAIEGAAAAAASAAPPAAAPEGAAPASAVAAPELLAFDAGGLSIWYPPVTKGKGPAPGLSGHSMTVLRDWGGAEPTTHAAAAAALACSGVAVASSITGPSGAAAASLSPATGPAEPTRSRAPAEPPVAHHQEYVVLFGGVRGRHYLCDTFLLNPRTYRWQQVRACCPGLGGVVRRRAVQSC
jgi:hypothetical protein